MPASPPMPETMYMIRNAQCPISRSSTGPTDHSVSMLKPMCHSDAGWCRNMAVTSVHGSRVIDAGCIMPKVSMPAYPAGHTNRNSVSSSHTATHRRMIAEVTTGSPLRHRARNDSAENIRRTDGESGNKLNPRRGMAPTVLGCDARLFSCRIRKARHTPWHRLPNRHGTGVSLGT